MRSSENKLVKNTLLLYIMTAAKLILPLITLPYLTRVLTSDSYGVVVYVKSIMSYVQIIIEFGFLLSATKDIVEIKDDLLDRKQRIGNVVGDTFAAQGILAVCSALFILVLNLFIPIVRENTLFVWLYFLSYVINIFLADFLFRGLEKMEMVSIPFVIAKTITTSMTFVFVKNDASMMWIPILEIVGNSVAVLFTTIYRRKIGIYLSFSKHQVWIEKLKASFVYFLSNFSTTAFGALNTLLIGILLTKTEVAYWGIVLQLVSAVQQMYQPIFNSLYPHMIKTKSKGLIHKILFIFMPIVVLGCIFCFICAKYIILIISGEQYINAVPLFRAMIPLMFLSFPSMLYGWPVLGAINKSKETTASTIIAALVQLLTIFIIYITNHFTLFALVGCRIISETSLFVIRYYYYRRYICEFND